jgi:hypothetical protein
MVDGRTNTNLNTLHDQMDANTVIAVASVVGVTVSLRIAYLQNERARFAQEISILAQMDSRFDGAEFRDVRSRAATWLSAGSDGADIEGEVATRELLNFFETLAYLYSKAVITAESAYHYFGSWILPYYEASRTFVKREQVRDQNCYGEFFALREAVFQIEREKTNCVETRKAISNPNVDAFLIREASQATWREAEPPVEATRRAAPPSSPVR